MGLIAQPEPPWKSWSVEEWEAHAERAEAFLALPEAERGKWVVGPAVVAMYRAGAARARAAQAAP